MKRASSTRQKAIQGNKITQAMLGILEGLCDIGYMSSTKKREMMYRVNTGDVTVYKEVRKMLLDMAADLKKIEK